MKNKAEKFVNSKVLDLNGFPPDKLTVIKWLEEFSRDCLNEYNTKRRGI